VIEARNIKDLRVDLDDIFAKLKRNDIEPKLAHELSNAAGKIISSCGAELKYAYQRGVMPAIKYLDTPETVDAWNKHQLEKSMRKGKKLKSLSI
jgi:hypothetical protein